MLRIHIKKACGSQIQTYLEALPTLEDYGKIAARLGRRGGLPQRERDASMVTGVETLLLKRHVCAEDMHISDRFKPQCLVR